MSLEEVAYSYLERLQRQQQHQQPRERQSNVRAANLGYQKPSLEVCEWPACHVILSRGSYRPLPRAARLLSLRVCFAWAGAAPAAAARQGASPCWPGVLLAAGSSRASWQFTWSPQLAGSRSRCRRAWRNRRGGVRPPSPDLQRGVATALLRDLSNQCDLSMVCRCRPFA